MTTDTNPDIQARITALAEDRDSGATDLAREALNILGEASKSFPEDGLAAYLDGIGVLLVLSRPTMASVKNAVSRALADGPLVHPGQAQRAFERARAWVDYATNATTHEAAAVLPDGATVLTCSYSTSVVKACAAAAAAGKRTRVVVLESKFEGTAYGEHLAQDLTNEGVEADVVSDDSLADATSGITMGLLGADRVMPDGSLVNGTPSLALAEQMKSRAPLYVVCETFKLDDGEYVEPGFDVIPADLVTGYVTDRGVVPPDQIWSLGRST